MTNILLVEDDQAIANSIVYYLSSQGFFVVVRDTMQEALEGILQKDYDIILLDVTLKDGNGFELFPKIKEKKDIPVIFLTALDEEANIVKGLEMGADDYVTKPFHARELLSRIKTVLRRTIKEEIHVITIEDIKIDLGKQKVFRDQKEITLTTLEYRILKMLFENKGKIVSRNQILDDIWDITEDFVNDNTLTVYIKRIREKIEQNPEKPSIIQTVRGTGYKIGE